MIELQTVLKYFYDKEYLKVIFRIMQQQQIVYYVYKTIKAVETVSDSDTSCRK